MTSPDRSAALGTDDARTYVAVGPGASVYVVWLEDYSQSCVMAIFTTLEAAHEYAEDQDHCVVVRWHLDSPHSGEWYV